MQSAAEDTEERVVEFGVRSVVVTETMSATVKLGREIEQSSSRRIGQPTAECPLVVWPSRRRWLQSELILVQGGAEGTEERFLALHTEMREKGEEVTSVEEGHDVEHVTEMM